MFTTKTQRTQRYFLVLLPSGCCAAGNAQSPQDEEFQQRNTALLNWYPDEGEVVIRASALAAGGRYVEALSIYDEALEKRPNTVVVVDKSRAYGLREYIM